MDKLNIKKYLDDVKYIVLDNGFNIISYENEEFSSHYINYATKYGSLDFTYKKNNKIIKHRPGIAHFLEHVMFNMPYGDAFEKFSSQLASANAYTSFQKTSYIFESSKNVEQNLTTLLEMVNTFSLDKQKVKKEKGIILEELSMYNKNPDWQIYSNSIKNSVNNSKYKDDILGSKKDIKKMTYNMLKEAYEDFYTPNNQYITIVGPNNEGLIKIVKDYMNDKKNLLNTIEKINKEEDQKNTKKDKINIINMDVSQEYIGLSLKGIKNDIQQLKTKIEIEILLELIYSDFNTEFIKQKEKQNIDYTFEYDILVHNNFYLLLFFIQNKNIYEFEKDILNLMKTSVLNENIEVLKNKKIGQLIKRFNEEKMLCELLNNLENYNYKIEDYFNILINLNEHSLKKYITDEKTQIKTKIYNKML